MYTIVDLCLLCLTYNKSLKKILSPDSDGVLVEEKLKYFLLDFNIEPDMSKHICLHCLKNLNHFYNFKKQCLRNIVKLKSYIHILKTVEEPCLNLQVSLFDMKHLVVNKGKCEYECNSEPIKTENFDFENVIVQIDPNEDDTGIEYIDEHIQKTQIDDEILRTEIYFKKQEYEHIFDNDGNEVENGNLTIEGVPMIAEYIDEHIQKTQVDNEILRNEFYFEKEEYENIFNNDGNEVEKENLTIEGISMIANDEVRNEIVDEIVEDVAENIEIQIQLDLDDNSKDILQNETTNYADTSSTASGNIKKVRNRIKSDTGLHKCKRCLEEFHTSKELTIHRRINHTERRYKCTTCNKAFSEPSKLKRHVRIHTGEKPYECDVCHKAFQVPWNLKTHKRLHNNVRPFKCDVCNKEFVQGGALTIHMRTHTGEKPYQCSLCSYKAVDSGAIKRHIRFHNNVRPFKCGVCNKEFVQGGALTIHMRTHTGEKPYQCSLCSYKAVDSGAIKRHNRFHNDVRPFKCGVCNKKFAKRGELTIHMRTHTGEKPYHCSLCSYKAVDNGTIKRHFRIHKK